MSFENLLDHLATPRPNGSEALEKAGAFIEETLGAVAPEVAVQTFTTAPYGFQILFSVCLLAMVSFAWALWRAWYGTALVTVSCVGATVWAETEWLARPIGGLITAVEKNIEAVFPGRDGAPTLIFSAHYDTATQFGDHHTWTAWATVTGLGLAAGLGASSLGLWRSRRGRDLPRPVRAIAATLALVGFVGTAWFFSVGPLVRTPSPGALDNASSVVVLLRLAEQLSLRPPHAATTVKLAFLAAEEEGALGSWHYAQNLGPSGPTAVVNLDVIGTGEGIAYAPEEGFVLTRYSPPAELVALIGGVVRDHWEEKLLAIPWPGMALSDARSFLAHDIPAITLFSPEHMEFPRGLHSGADDRERLSERELSRIVELLEAIVTEVDLHPGFLGPDVAQGP